MYYHLYYDLNIIYYALSELTSKIRSLCVITASINFFLTITIYATILTMHYYERELFNEKKKKRRLSKSNGEDNKSLKEFLFNILK